MGQNITKVPPAVRGDHHQKGGRVSAKIKDRHLFNAGAAACAVCCAPPILALLGIAGAGAVATIATIAFTGLAYGLVVLTASLLGVWARTRRAQASVAPCSEDGPVDVTISAAAQDALKEHTGRRAGRILPWTP